MSTALVLASASPRRRDLLAAAGLGFVVEPSGADEDVGGDLGPEPVAQLLALRKARSIAEGYRGQRRFVIGADTVVAVGLEASADTSGPGNSWQLLGKPVDEAQAAGMLRSLSGTRHAVVTGVCVIATESGDERVEAECTWVTMRVIDPAEVAAYVESGEWQDKAGGYAIQENADAFVTRLEGGGFDNVVGLPVARVLRMLREAGAELP